MRPTLSEQIIGARRVLVELAAPEVSDSYTQEQVAFAAAALEHAAARWSEVLPDLVTDIRALEDVLGIEPSALEEAVPGVVHLAAAEAYHRDLRSQLTDEIRSGSEQSPEVRAYLADSTERLK
ncbi:MAG: hypothetical protein F4129_13655 [Acidimicrobiia bacterium]|nr:hypothetical protein [Acidimicrobiia bacterium]MYG57443.1 hypothetical protein [Acidimicrobiia bacterium]MYH97537.1 hypothetical protein [Acidimicrobiia bacterium]MYJ31798.1 hypothetical protein [Acidimicrobiia bacterium]MYL08256.1 hypothetical protein [Acidimicrobiia bacterium]